VLVLGACAKAGSSAGTGDSGIQGTVLLGPACPVQAAERPCPDKPIAADLVVTNADGHKVASARSGKDGKFRITLPSGTYEVKAMNLNGMQLSKPVSVTVPPGRFIEVTVPVDSGIR
jgi:hypothetical protein